MTAILGINCFSHDTAACLLVDGEVVAFAEEERFNRETHTKSFPHAAIGYCLAAGSLSPPDIDIVAFAHHPATDFARGATDAVLRLAPKRLAAQAYTDGRLLLREQAFRRRWNYRGQLVHVGHHDAHAASAYYASPYDSAAVLTLDRGGDFLSTTVGVGEGSRLRTLRSVRNPHSLGELYTAFTWHLGFTPGADEGKVMGLAPYGTDRLVPSVRPLVHPIADGRFRLDLSWFRYQREGQPVSRRFLREHGLRRTPESEITDHHRDLAYAVQSVLEDTGLHVARALQRATGHKRLCLSGGVALNSVMNARLLREAGFEEVFVQAAASDAGNALGAALWVWHRVMGQPRSWRLQHAFFGPSYDEPELAAALSSRGVPFRRVGDPAADAADRLVDGQVVGWFQGRAELGPRALGARSILADPRRAEMKDVVNARIKHREGFRPFAPSVLDERGPEYFDGYACNPFMLLVLPIRAAMQERIPAVTHVDGTGRLQSVTADFNPSFHRLISEFDRRTGVPVVLNTSFNVRGEPMVNRPEEAVEDFLRTELDALYLGPLVAEKAKS